MKACAFGSSRQYRFASKIMLVPTKSWRGNENSLHDIDGCSVRAVRLRQQQQSAAAGKNYGRRTAGLDYNGDLPGRNSAPLPVGLSS